MVAYKTNLSPFAFNNMQWILIAFMFFHVVLAEAGKYTLDKAENNFILPDEVKEICSAYVENLNKFDEPMVCDRKIDPDMKAFSKPEWNVIDPNKHPELIGDLALFWTEIDIKARRVKEVDKGNKILDYKTKLHERAKIGALIWHLGRFDIDNDGKEDIVLHTQSVEYQCDPDKNFIMPSHGKVLILKKENGLHIDMEVTKYIYISSWNVFQYMSSTFFDLWDGRANRKEAEIQVYYPLRTKVVTGIGNHLICRIKFKIN